jgi:uncharacterized protein DUF87
MNTPGQHVCIGARISGEHVMLDAEERRRHLYVVGQTGTGKSTVLLNLIRQDLLAGEGIALLDPHGDLAESVLSHIPRARTNDLVYINPADIKRPIGLNPLSCVPHDLRPIVADGVVSYQVLWNAFKRIAAGHSADEKTALFSGAAKKAYRLVV